MIKSRMINLSALNPKEKRECWEQIKTKKPELATMLSEDKTFKSLVDTFDGDVLVERSLVNE